MSKKAGKVSHEPTSSSGKALPPIKPAYAAPMPTLVGSSSAPSLSGKRRKELLVKEREDKWRISPSAGIPKYSAELDPNCPTGQIKRFNDENRMHALAIADMKKTSQWAKSAVESTFQDVPLKVNISLRTKAMNALVKQNNQDAYAEVEILQKIIIRENLLKELHKLVKTEHDIVTNMSEIIELVKALRYQTVDIIEDISAWQDVQSYPKPFLYKELNYLVKIKCDLDFLDLHEEIVERFCFEFKSNPLAYRGGGTIITGYERSNFSSGNEFRKGYVNNYYDPVESAYVDDIEIVRLHNAEKVIQKEFNRLAQEKNHPVKMQPQHHQQQQQQHQYVDSSSALSSKALPQLQIDSTGSNDPNAYLMLQSVHSSSPNAVEPGSSSGTSNHLKAHKKTAGKSSASPNNNAAGSANVVPSQRKLKLERIAVLSDEANEFKSMMSHIEDQIAVLVDQHRATCETRKLYEGKQREAQAQGRDNTALRIAAEVTVVKNDLLEINKRIKDLQRESYFIGLERKRKIGTIQQIQMELDETKRKEALKKKIEAKIKKEGLLSALKSFGASGAGDFSEIVLKSAEEEGKSPKKVGGGKKKRPKTPNKKTSSGNGEGMTSVNSGEEGGAIEESEARDDLNTGSHFNTSKTKKKNKDSNSAASAAPSMVFSNSPERWLNKNNSSSSFLHTHTEEEDDSDDLDEPPGSLIDSQYDGQGESYLGQDSYVGRYQQEDENEEDGELELVDNNDDNNEGEEMEESGELLHTSKDFEGGTDEYDHETHQQHESFDSDLADTAAGEGNEEAASYYQQDYHSSGYEYPADTSGAENYIGEEDEGATANDAAVNEGEESDYMNFNHHHSQTHHQYSSDLPPTYQHHHHHGGSNVSPLRTSGDSGIISNGLEEFSVEGGGLSLQYSEHDDQSTVFGLADSPASQLMQFSVDSTTSSYAGRPLYHSSNSGGGKQFQSPTRYTAGGEHYNYISDSDNEEDPLSYSGQQHQSQHISANGGMTSPLNSILESNDMTSPQYDALHQEALQYGGGIEEEEEEEEEENE